MASPSVLDGIWIQMLGCCNQSHTVPYFTAAKSHTLRLLLNQSYQHGPQRMCLCEHENLLQQPERWAYTHISQVRVSMPSLASCVRGYVKNIGVRMQRTVLRDKTQIVVRQSML